MGPAGFQDHYLTLQVTPTTALPEIKKAYHRLALEHHPDKHFGDRTATRLFQRIAAAWEILSDREKKAKYDVEYRSFHASQGRDSGAAGTHDESPPSWADVDERMDYEIDKKRKEEWSTWLRIRNIHIDSLQKMVDKLNSELDVLRQKDKEDEELAATVESVWNKWNPWVRPPLTKEERDGMKADRIRRVAAKRVKEADLSGYKAQLDQMEKEKKAKAVKEQLRQDTYQALKTQRENDRRRKKEYDEQKKERLEKQRAERMRREQERRDQEKRDQEKEQLEKKRRQRQKQQRAQRGAQQQRSKSDFEQCPQDNIPPYSNRSQSGNTGPGPSPEACQHRIYWDKIERRLVCPHCQQLQYRFLYQCSLCSTTGCAKCMQAMKNGTASNSREHATSNQENYFSYFDYEL